MIYSLSLQENFHLGKRLIILTAVFVLFNKNVFSQAKGFSITTDLDIQRSFKKEQQYWAVGQTAQVQFHFTQKETIYFWFAYYSNGKFSNDLTASAKNISTNPQTINYLNDARMRFKHLSLGWKHYFKGTYDADQAWNLYSYAGFGLMLGQINNSQSVPVDTSVYYVPVLNGKATFKRLTFDLGLGWEVNLGGDIYFYNEARVWIPTTDYPSNYILINQNAPVMGSLNFGIRILFD